MCSFSCIVHSLLCIDVITLFLCVRVCVCNVHVLCCLLQRDRKGRNDRITGCQNWQDIKLDDGLNDVGPIETSAKVVDGRQKVCDPTFVSTLAPAP